MIDYVVVVEVQHEAVDAVFIGRVVGLAYQRHVEYGFGGLNAE